ncbi:MAG TPA: 2Fe-2S iron-sulfur cluster-binding protein, partial [Ilumatobacteraceae bacterium]|nr:2Fe-2S iron-sulfur cluster-binding protein [Ilumatobacteraceae bacterium]
MTSSRLPIGGTEIDRNRSLAFTFDDVPMTGYAGDTLASALLANGVPIVGRSIYHDRPRGIVSAGPEEPNALVQVRWPTGVSEPMVNAATSPLDEGLAAWSLTGMGRLETATDDARFDARHAHVEVLVIGAGPAGRAAARSAREDDPDARVLVVDRDPRRSRAGDDVLAGTTALGVYDHGYVTAIQRRPVPGTEGRLWRIRAGRIVLATGATERPIAFADDDRPGVMLASAAGTYVRRYGVRPGDRAVVFTTNDTTRDVEAALAEAGTDVVAVVDARRAEAVVGTDADDAGRLRAVRTADGRTLEADLLVVSGGWDPNVALWTHARGTLHYDERIAAFVPDQSPVTTPMTAVGAAAGDIDGLGEVAAVWSTTRDDAEAARAYVDPGRDATVSDVRRALDAGLASIEHVKRYTTIGTGIEQGRSGGVVASAIAAAMRGEDVGAVGLPTFRPPLVPVTFAQVAGRDRGPVLADPVRMTAIHDRHVARGAVFEDVGQWKRPRYFPLGDESMDDAVTRECIAARTGVAAMDASTLGKIDIQGPDAGIFLDRIYTNLFSSLKVGSCRYGLMCKPDGMVFDDGVTSRLADDRFHMTTTTGNAAPVLDHLEEWPQTEWP